MKFFFNAPTKKIEIFYNNIRLCVVPHCHIDYLDVSYGMSEVRCVKYMLYRRGGQHATRQRRQQIRDDADVIVDCTKHDARVVQWATQRMYQRNNMKHTEHSEICRCLDMFISRCQRLLPMAANIFAMLTWKNC